VTLNHNNASECHDITALLTHTSAPVQSLDTSFLPQTPAVNCAKMTNTPSSHVPLHAPDLDALHSPAV